jgi:AraC-like DNA-binding protein
MLGGPRHQADIGHPVPGGDTGTAVLFTAELVAAVAAGSLDLPPFSFATPYVRAAHRRLLRAWGTGGDACDLEERSIALLAAVLAAAEPVRVAARSPRAQGRARLCDEARAAIVSDPALSSVVDLARVLDCSPYHLSRAFREQTGLTFSEYRRNVRLGLAVERILDGERSMAQVAADCGFADHAHLTRTFRKLHRLTPSQLRRISDLEPVTATGAPHQPGTRA